MRPALTEYMIKNVKPKEKAFMLSDGGGLYLQVLPQGGKYWILRIYIHSKEIRRSLGTYPKVSLKAARVQAFEIKQLNDKNLSADKQTFGDVYKLFYNSHYLGLSESYLKVINMRWENHIKPKFESLKLREITPAMISAVCRSIDKKGYNETARRVMGMISNVYEYAIAEGFTDTNPATSVSRVLSKHKSMSHAAVTGESEIAMLMRRIYAYDKFLVRSAMIFSALTFCRPGEVRHAEWQEISFDEKLWVIPADKMKMRKEHLVPLSEQCLALLCELKHYTGHTKWLFPSARSDTRSMSEGAVRVALRSMGYDNDQMTPHGFRSMASTVLNNYDWDENYIERQLAHVDGSVRGVYNRADYLQQRRAMVQWYSDYLDALRKDREIPKKPEDVI